LTVLARNQAPELIDPTHRINVASAVGDAGGRLRPFVARIPAPLSIGTLMLADGQAVKGFLVEAQAVSGARDISSFGGWRAYIAEAKATT
jgi:hypothetical protein